jgi:hypothetical protein
MRHSLTPPPLPRAQDHAHTTLIGPMYGQEQRMKGQFPAAAGSQQLLLLRLPALTQSRLNLRNKKGPPHYHRCPRTPAILHDLTHTWLQQCNSTCHAVAEQVCAGGLSSMVARAAAAACCTATRPLLAAGLGLLRPVVLRRVPGAGLHARHRLNHVLQACTAHQGEQGGVRPGPRAASWAGRSCRPDPGAAACCPVRSLPGAVCPCASEGALCPAPPAAAASWLLRGG